MYCGAAFIDLILNLTDTYLDFAYALVRGWDVLFTPEAPFSQVSVLIMKGKKGKFFSSIFQQRRKWPGWCVFALAAHPQLNTIA